MVRFGVVHLSHTPHSLLSVEVKIPSSSKTNQRAAQETGADGATGFFFFSYHERLSLHFPEIHTEMYMLTTLTSDCQDYC